MEIGLKALQRLAKEMQEGVGFSPEINCRETDVDALITDIRENAKDLDAVQDKDAISDAGKKTLIALDAGPWQEEKEPEPAEVVAEDEEEGEKPKKEVKKTKKTVKKKAVKAPAKKAVALAEKKAKPKKETKTKVQQKKKEIQGRGQGIGIWAKEQLKKNKNVSNSDLAEKTRKKFPGAKTTPANIAWYRYKLRNE